MKISDLVILSENRRSTLTLFKFMTEHAGVPATDESASVVTLQNGSKLVFDFIDYEIIPIGNHA